MLGRIRSHVRSNAVAYVALFVALSGTAVAAGVTGRITGKQIRNDSVTGKDVRESSLAGVGAGVVMARIDSAPAGFQFAAPAGTTASPAGGPGPVQMVTPGIALQLRDLQVQLTTAPGAGATNARFTGVGVVNSDGSISNLQCLAQGTQTSCSAPGPLAVPAGSPLVAFSDGTSGTPISDVLIGYRLTPAASSQAKKKP